eukprot:TRINITY_DN23018_c0_g1_i1.p1 TRINITY_DN23018_c0_g1~~TRINITY_DN23018_c0_g1_i1.p1  ORF type:complete len:152 (-),score=22.92 TRINITY_DN23018_c0_g1_i1:172-627(-)
MEFNRLRTLFFTALLLLPSMYAKQVDYCDRKGEYAVKVKGVDMSPDPVVKGKPATFKISATTEEAISGGKLVIEVSYSGVHIHSETHDLCAKTSCPVSTGDFVLSHTQSLPGFTPTGSYTLKMKMVGASGEQLTCIGFGFRIGSGSSAAYR